MQNSIYLVVGTIIVVAFCVLTYILLFKSRSSNYPTAGRGVGILLLAGILKVIFLLLGEKVSETFNSGWFNGALVVLLVVGLLMMMSGFASGD